MSGLIWWVWTAVADDRVHVFDVSEAMADEPPDVRRPRDNDVSCWGEVAWTARADNAGLGLL